VQEELLSNNNKEEVEADHKVADKVVVTEAEVAVDNDDMAL